MTKPNLRSVVLLVLAPVALGALIRSKAALRPRALPIAQQGQQLTITSDGRYLVQGNVGWVGSINSYDLQSGKRQSQHPKETNAGGLGTNTMVALRGTHLIAGLCPDDNYLANSVALYDLDYPAKFRVLAKRRIAGLALAASPIAPEIAAFNTQEKLCFWNVKTGLMTRQWKGFAGKKNGNLTQRFAGNGLNRAVPQALAFSPNGKILAMGGLYITYTAGGGSGFQMAAGSVALWDVKTGRKLHNCVLPTYQQMTSLHSHGFGWSAFTCTSLLFSPNGRWLATDSNGDGVVLWNVATGAVHQVLPHPEGALGGSNLFGGRGVSFSPDNRLIAAAGNHGSLDLWDVKTGKLLHQIRASGPAVFLPDGRLVTGSADQRGNMLIWNIS